MNYDQSLVNIGRRLLEIAKVKVMNAQVELAMAYLVEDQDSILEKEWELKALELDVEYYRTRLMTRRNV